MLAGLAIYTIVLAIPAVLVGWLLQFVICAMLDYFHRNQTRDEKPVA